MSQTGSPDDELHTITRNLISVMPAIKNTIYNFQLYDGLLNL